MSDPRDPAVLAVAASLVVLIGVIVARMRPSARVKRLERAERWAEAAELATANGLHDRAIDAFVRAGMPDRAAQSALRAGRKARAEVLLAQAADAKRAAPVVPKS